MGICCRTKIRADGDFLGQSGHFRTTGIGRWAADFLWYRTYSQNTKYLSSFWLPCCSWSLARDCVPSTQCSIHSWEHSVRIDVVCKISRLDTAFQGWGVE